MIVREDHTKNGSWAWARLRERFGRDSGATGFTEVFQYGWPSEKPFENVWRDWVKKVSKLPSGSLSSQLTISRLSRHGQPELDKHLRVRAPLAWQDSQTQVEKYLSTIYHQQSPQPMDIIASLTGTEARVAEAKHIRERTVGTKMRLARLVANKDTWQRFCKSGNTQTPRHGSSKGTGRGSEKGSGNGKDKAKKRTPETCLCCANEGHKKSDCKFKNAKCSNCGKVGHLRAACRNTNTHEIEKDDDEPSPEVTVEAVWCMAAQGTVENDHCDHNEKRERSSEHRDGLSCGKS